MYYICGSPCTYKDFMDKLEDLNKFYLGIGDNIKKFRTKRDYSQDDLAKFLDLTRTSVVNIEKGRQRPPIHTLFEIANFLNVPIEDLFPTEKEKLQQIDFKFLQERFKSISMDKEKIQHFFHLSSTK